MLGLAVLTSRMKAQVTDVGVIPGFQINQGQSIDWNVCNGCSFWWYEVNDFLANLLTDFGWGMDALFVIPFRADNPHLGDLAPGSGVVASLVNNPGLEQAAAREAIAVDVQDYGAAPFRLLADAGTADALAAAVAIWSLELDLGGLSLYEAATDESQCYDTDVCPTVANIGNSDDDHRRHHWRSSLYRELPGDRRRPE